MNNGVASKVLMTIFKPSLRAQRCLLGAAIQLDRHG
jgi:hypothetical protein